MSIFAPMSAATRQGTLYKIELPASMIGYDLPHELVADRNLSLAAKVLYAVGVSIQRNLRRISPDAKFDVKQEVGFEIIGLTEDEYERACDELRAHGLFNA